MLLCIRMEIGVGVNGGKLGFFSTYMLLSFYIYNYRTKRLHYVLESLILPNVPKEGGPLSL